MNKCSYNITEVKVFCLKNTSIGWRPEQSAAAQLSPINGRLGVKPRCWATS